MRRLTFIRAAAVALAAGCAPAATAVPAGSEFTLAPAATATIRGTGHSVTFIAVRSDSRCPSDVTCVWAGNAVVDVRVRGASVDTVVTLNTGIEPRAVAVGAIRIELVRLAPHPVSTAPIAAADYRATFVARSSP